MAIDYAVIAKDTFSGIGQASIYIFYGLIALAFIGAVYYIRTFNIKFRVRKLSGGKTLIVDTMAKRKIESDGTTKIVLRNFREPAPEPPAECINITAKGKEAMEAYYNPESREYIYIRDQYHTDETRLKSILDDTKNLSEDVRAERLKSAKIISTLEPFTSNDREFMAYNEIRAISRKKANWKENLPFIIGGAFMIVLLVIIMMFWGDVMKPLNESAKLHQQNLQLENQIMIGLKEIIQKEHILGVGNWSNAPEVPS